MENEVVVNEAVNEEVTNEVEAVEEKGNGLKKAGLIALGVVATVATVKLAKKAWKKWVKPAIDKRKAKKAADSDVIYVDAENTNE